MWVVGGRKRHTETFIRRNRWRVNELWRKNRQLGAIIFLSTSTPFCPFHLECGKFFPIYPTDNFFCHECFGERFADEQCMTYWRPFRVLSRFLDPWKVDPQCGVVWKVKCVSVDAESEVREKSNFLSIGGGGSVLLTPIYS